MEQTPISPEDAKALDVLNQGGSFLPIKRVNELEINKKYLIVSGELKKTKFGKRMVLTLTEETEQGGFDFESSLSLLFLGPSFAEGKKYNSLKNLLQENGKQVSVKVVKFREDNGMKIPIYEFSTKDFVKVGEYESTL